MLAARTSTRQERVTQQAKVQFDPEAALIEAASAGDMSAFRALYDLHLPFVTRAVARLLGRSPEFEDVVQEAFIQVFRSLGSYRGECAFTTWLYRVARNVSIDHLRKRRITTVELDAWRPLAADSDEWAKLEARDLCRVLYAFFYSRCGEHREVFVLHEVEGMKLREIAELTNESINTVAARVRRTRERLQAVLENTMREIDP